jgi:hypothetical protein
MFRRGFGIHVRPRGRKISLRVGRRQKVTKVDRATLNGVTAHASCILLQTLGSLLVDKGLIAREEWQNCMKEGATFLQNGTGMSPDQLKAAEMLTMMHNAIANRKAELN